jgi:hypothetical protein
MRDDPAGEADPRQWMARLIDGHQLSARSAR